jgi:hypothetical protein
MLMECPKCGGGGFLSEEELVKTLDERFLSRGELKAVIRATFVCRACSEKFSRIFVEDIAKRKKPEPTGPQTPSGQPPSTPYEEKSEPAEGLKFF